MKEKIKLYFPLLILFCTFISIFLIKFSYISIIISGICIILGIIFLKKRIRLLIIIIIISITTIITSSIIMYKEKERLTDKYEGINILLGTWLYNEYGGTYMFNDDYTYIQYSNENTADNYCVGKYNYTYGGISNDGVIIREDANYYYYNLNLTEDYCIIMGKEDYSKYEKKMVFALNKDKEENLLINKESENMFTLTKVD